MESKRGEDPCFYGIFAAQEHILRLRTIGSLDVEVMVAGLIAL